MSNYKNVRLEEHVYQELIRRMKPRESMSQVIERLLHSLDEIRGHIKAAAAAYVESFEDEA